MSYLASAIALMPILAGVTLMSKSPNLLPSAQKPSNFYIPPEGFVPDKETAARIAEAVWLPIYGKEVLEKRPL